MRNKKQSSKVFLKDYKHRLYAGFTTLAMFFLLPYAFFQFKGGQTLIAIIYIIAAIFIACLWFFANKSPAKLELATNLFAGVGPIVLAPWQITGGVENTGIFWFFAYIIFVITFLDYIAAAFWLFVTYGLSVLLTFLHSNNLVGSPYQTTYMYHFYFASFIISLLLLTFVYLRENLKIALEARTLALEEAQTIANIGSWEWNIKKDEIIMSKHLEKLFSFEAGTKVSLDTYMQLVYEPDKKKIMDVVETAIATGAPFEQEHRVKQIDGKIHWMRSRGRVMKNDLGEVIKLNGIAQDITDQKKTEDELRSQNNQLKNLEKIMVDRELKMVELKQDISRLQGSGKSSE